MPLLFAIEAISLQTLNNKAAHEARLEGTASSVSNSCLVKRIQKPSVSLVNREETLLFSIRWVVHGSENHWSNMAAQHASGTAKELEVPRSNSECVCSNADAAAKK